MGDRAGSGRHRHRLLPVNVVGPCGVIAKGRPSDTSFQTGTTVVRTRSGAATYLSEFVAHAGGGTIALNLRGPGKSESIAGVVRADSLPPLSC
jgi:hypothetical protein